MAGFVEGRTAGGTGPGGRASSGMTGRVGRPEHLSDPKDWKPKSGEIPTQPGVYRFRDASGRVIYVGKAINLRQRLSNYFQPLRSLHQRTRHMVLSANQVEWTVVGSDFEALQLEYTWIKEFDPPYNVKFRDDKTYPYMAITMADEAPRVMVTRNHRIPGARYFGPYPKIWAVRETIELMVKAFPIRTCSDSSYAKAMASGRPCFAGQIGRCGGPCSQKVTIEQHREIVDQFVTFMASHDRTVITRLQREMKEASAALEYEQAARLRDRIQALENVLEKSAVVLPDGVDTDVFGIEEDELAAAVQQFVIRGGRVRGVRSWVVDKEIAVTTGELVEQMLESAYESEPPPREIIVPALPDDATALEKWLAAMRPRGGAVALRTAQRGDKAAVLQTATLNAKQALMLYKSRRSSDYVARTQALNDIQDALGLAEAPLRMECYDVSHLGGTNIVASMVVFEDGLPKKSAYRKFAVNGYADDLESLHQVLTRRLSHLEDDDISGVEEAEPETEDGSRPRRRGGDSCRAAAPPLRVSSRLDHRRRRPTPGGGGGAHAGRARHRRHPDLRSGQATRGDLAARQRLPGDPSAKQRGIVHAATHPRRGSPLRDHLPARQAQERHRLCAGRGSGPRAGQSQGAAQALRFGETSQGSDARSDR